MQNINCFSSIRRSIIVCLAVVIIGQDVKAQASFAAYKPYLLTSRDTFMVFADAVVKFGLTHEEATARRVIDSLEQFALDQKNEELQQNALLLKAGFMGWFTPERDQGLATLLQVKRWAEDKKQDYIWLRACNLLGLYYYNSKQYDLAFGQYLESWPLLRSVPASLVPEKKRNIQNIATIYHNFGDYRESIFYLLQAYQVGSNYYNRFDNFTILNTLGMCYRSLNMYDSSNYYFKAVSLLKGCPAIWKIIADGNLGENYVNQGLYSQALPLLQVEFDAAATYFPGDRGLIVHGAMYLAEIGFRTGNLAEAERHTRYAQQFLEQTKDGQGHSQEPHWRFYHLYSLLARLNAAEGKMQLASLYSDSAAAAKDSIGRQFSSLNLLRAQQKIDRQQHEKSLVVIKQKKIQERNSILAIAGFALLGTLWLYGRQRRRHRFQQLIKDVELQKARADMENSNLQLQDFARNILEKNNLVEQLEAKMGDTNVENIKQLHHSSILSNEEWERFRLLFEKVHDGYLQNLRLKIPNISPAEMRFMALARLGFSNKEMAASLGVSAEAVRSVWHRLRKKLVLPDDTRLEDFVQSI
ncbi:MAG: hypothetical protein V4717_12150 [Bacteroidota bacterium]